MPEPRPSFASHRLAWLDQLAYELFRATGRNQLMQCLWLYDREVDMAALVRTAERLAAMSFNRLVEPSPLPMGRPRWVKPAIAPELPRLGPEILPRRDFLQWANRHARLPVDPVAGPAGRMAVQRFDDGGTAVSLVMSHLLLDGMGALRAIEAAANGTGLPSPYAISGSRNWLKACAEDARQVLEDAPRTIAALARVARAAWRAPASPVREPSGTHSGASIVDLPAVAVSIDTQAWFACEQRLGGSVSTLLPGLVARLASHLGRRRSDGGVNLIIPINRREGLGDDRALAIDFHMMSLAPDGLATDLKPVGVALKNLLRGARENRADTLTALLPGIAWMPRSAAKALVNRLFNYADALPVSCSDLGPLPDGLARIDGAPCQRVLTRAVDVNVSRADLERSHGHLVVVASRYGKTVTLCIEAFQTNPAPTSVDVLRTVTARTLADFGLAGDIET